MAGKGDNNPVQQPIIIKKIKKGGHGAHAPAWKLAYADFVTAMMAFFLLMWLLGSTDEVKKKGIAEYFANPLKVTLQGGQDSSGAQTILEGGGKDLTAQEGYVSKGDPESNPDDPEQRKPRGEPGSAGAQQSQSTQVDSQNQQQQQKINEDSARKALEERDKERLEQLQKQLEQMLNINPILEQFKDQIKIEITREGLRIQILDQEKRPMFDSGRARLAEYADNILREIGPVINAMPNRITVQGHTDSKPFPGEQLGYSNWELSADRANAARRALKAGGLDTSKVLRVIGVADSAPFVPDDPSDSQNRRISVVVLSAEAERQILEDAQGSTELPSAPTR